MYQKHKVACVIPARGGSKGVPRKNVLPLCGLPLIAHTIKQALQSKHIDRLLVSTDDDEIARIARQYGAEVPFVRPLELSGDHVSSEDVVLHALQWLENAGHGFDIIVKLLATSPLRTPEDIDACISLLEREKADNVFSVTPAGRNPYFNMVEIHNGKVVQVKPGTFASRQTAPPVYDLNASIYVWWADVFKRTPALFLDRTRVYIMPRERSVDIDDAIDFKLVQLIMEERHGA